jgi:hypothetical protein
MCEGDVLETSPIRGRIAGHAARVFITGGLARSDWDVRFWHIADFFRRLTVEAAALRRAYIGNSLRETCYNVPKICSSRPVRGGDY